MIATILVPLDGSDLARRALPYAARLAGAARARLVLLRAVLVPPMPGFGDWQAQKEAVEEARRDLEDVATPLRAGGLTVDVEIGAGDAAWAIRHAATSLPADLVVMSTHGRGGLGRWFYGSVADRVLRLSTTPVMLVPASRTAPPPVLDGRLRVLVPLDGSALAEEALVPAREMAGVLGAEIVLLQVVDPFGLPSDAVVWMTPRPAADVPASNATQLKVAAHEYLREVASRPLLQGIATIELAELGEASHLIGAVARDYGAAMVVMATHGRGGLARLVMGSVASTVVQHAVTPVVLVRPAVLASAPIDEGGTAPASDDRAEPRVALDLDPSDRAVLIEGLEHLEAAADGGSREAAQIGALIARLRRAADPTSTARDR